MFSTVLANVQAHEVVNELPVATWVYGAAVFVVLMFLLLATVSLRSVGLRHEEHVTEIEKRTSQRNYNTKN